MSAEDTTLTDPEPDPEPVDEGKEGKGSLITMHDGTAYESSERFTTTAKRLREATDGQFATVRLNNGRRIAVNPSLVASVEEVK